MGVGMDVYVGVCAGAWGGLMGRVGWVVCVLLMAERWWGGMCEWAWILEARVRGDGGVLCKEMDWIGQMGRWTVLDSLSPLPLQHPFQTQNQKPETTHNRAIHISTH